MKGDSNSSSTTSRPHYDPHPHKYNDPHPHQYNDHQDNHDDTNYEDRKNNSNIETSNYSTPPRKFTPSHESTRNSTPSRNYTSDHNSTPSRNYTPDHNSTPSRNYTPSYYSSTNSSPYSNYRSSRIISDIHDKLKSSSNYRHSNGSNNISMVSTSNNSYESTLAVAKASAKFKHIYTTIPSHSITLNNNNYNNNDTLNHNTLNNKSTLGNSSNKTKSSVDLTNRPLHPSFDDRFNNLWSRYKQETGSNVDTMISNRSTRMKDYHDGNYDHDQNYDHNSISRTRRDEEQKINGDEEKLNVDEDTTDTRHVIVDNIQSTGQTTVDSSSINDNNNSMNDLHNHRNNHHRFENSSTIDTPNSVSIDAYSSKDTTTILLSPDAQEIYSDIGKLSEKIDTKLKASI